METLYTLDGSTITASGVSSVIRTGEGLRTAGYGKRIDRAWLTAYAKGAVSGADALLVVTYEQQDGLGNYITIKQLANIIAAGYSTGLLGVDIPISAAGRVRWTVTGTDPQFLDVDITLMGHA